MYAVLVNLVIYIMHTYFFIKTLPEIINHRTVLKIFEDTDI